MNASEHGGDASRPETAEVFLRQLYDELRQLARARMALEPPGQTLQATALVHEAYLRLAGQRPEGWANRAHYFAAASEAMRRILVDRARRRRAAKHGGGQAPLPLEDLAIAAPGPDDEVLAVHDALERLAARDPEKAEIVKLRYFAGLTFAEVAEVLGNSVPTVKRHWTFARAWLFREMTANDDQP